MNNYTKTCVICSQPSIIIKTLSKDLIQNNLIRSGILNNNLEIEDYNLMRCEHCGLEFSNPMLEPTSLFYEEIIKNNNKYYPTYRWEWGKILSLLQQGKNIDSRKINLLDVGCGSGIFLELVRKNSKTIDAIGIDSTSTSIEVCKSKGLNALCCTLNELNGHTSEQIDIITLWHVLEHISDPLSLIQTAKNLITSNGSIYFSVPLSPASYETLKLDPLNLPPHHLTRWSIPSLLKLAEVSNMSIEIFLPETNSFLFRVIRSIVVTTDNSFSEKNKIKKLINVIKLILRNPILPLKAIFSQLSRPKYKNQVLPDVVLVKLKKI